MKLGSYALDFAVVSQNLGKLEAGIEMTVAISLIAIVVSLPLGLGGALLREFGPRWLRRLVFVYVECLRNLPLLVVLYLLFFVIPSRGIPISAFMAGVLALTLNGVAFSVEIFRGGLHAIPKGQYEAATALGLDRRATLRYVVGPQLLRVVLPSVRNQVVSTVLGSAQASVIGVSELTYQTMSVGASSFRYFEIFLAAGAFYVIAIQLFTLASRVLTRGIGRPMPTSR